MFLPLVIVDTRLGELDFAEVRMVPPEGVPAPYHDLLVHPHHMTVQVEGYFGHPVDVRVLSSQREGDIYQRKILLELKQSRKVVQFGLVRIDLSCCSAPVAKAIVEEKTPLGRILIEHEVLRRVEPTAFVRVDPKPTLQGWFAMPQAVPLHGRTGVIFCDDRPAIAVLEVLAPVS